MNNIPYKKINKLGMAAHASTSRIWEVVAGRPGVKGQLELHSEFKVSLSYMRSCLKRLKEKKAKLINCFQFFSHLNPKILYIEESIYLLSSLYPEHA